VITNVLVLTTGTKNVCLGYNYLNRLTKIVHYEDTKTIIVRLHHRSKRVKNEVLCFTSSFYTQEKHMSVLFQKVASMKK